MQETCDLLHHSGCVQPVVRDTRRYLCWFVDRFSYFKSVFNNSNKIVTLQSPLPIHPAFNMPWVIIGVFIDMFRARLFPHGLRAIDYMFRSMYSVGIQLCFASIRRTDHLIIVLLNSTKRSFS